MKVVVVSRDVVGSRMAGPGVRAWKLASELARRFEVVLTTPNESDFASDDFELVQIDPNATRALVSLGRTADVVVAQRLDVATAFALARAGVRLIFDLYAPITLENLAFDAMHTRSRMRGRHFRLNLLEQDAALATGSAFICAGERQRDFWLGALIARGDEAYAKAKEAGRLNDLPVNHSPRFAPVIHPTLETGVEALVVAARAWLVGGLRRHA